MSLTCTPQNPQRRIDGRGSKPEIPMRKENGAMLLRFHKISVATLTLLAAAVSQDALAQSTGTEAVEESMSEVVVSATRVRSIGIVGDQNAPKSRVTLTAE